MVSELLSLAQSDYNTANRSLTVAARKTPANTHGAYWAARVSKRSSVT